MPNETQWQKLLRDDNSDDLSWVPEPTGRWVFHPNDLAKAVARNHPGRDAPRSVRTAHLLQAIDEVRGGDGKWRLDLSTGTQWQRLMMDEDPWDEPPKPEMALSARSIDMLKNLYSARSIDTLAFISPSLVSPTWLPPLNTSEPFADTFQLPPCDQNSPEHYDVAYRSSILNEHSSLSVRFTRVEHIFENHGQHIRWFSWQAPDLALVPADRARAEGVLRSLDSLLNSGNQTHADASFSTNIETLIDRLTRVRDNLRDWLG